MWLKFPAVSDKAKNLSDNGLVATLGNFDGIHLGHQSLISAVNLEASKRGLRPALITFSPHPAKLIRGSAPRRLTKFYQIIELSKSHGVTDLIVLHFDKAMSQLEPEEFVDRILIKKLNVKHLVIGPYARIGKDRKGNVEWILKYFESKCLSASLLPPFFCDAERVSSNLIRDCISRGDLEHAAKLLGRPFAISGKVISGDSRGRELGFPTANIKIGNYVKPPHGVYFCKTVIDRKRYFALANFGVRPTFGGSNEVLEVFLMDYEGSALYKERLDIALLKKIRDERKFESPQALQNQIQIDLTVAQELIEKESPN